MLPYPSFRIGKIFGIPIEVNSTWFIVFVLVTFSLVFYEFPIRYRELNQFFWFIDGVITSTLFFSSVLLHELSHSLVARRYGIKIKRITLFIFGGIAEMTGEPGSPSVEIKMALAGPAASFCLSLIFWIIWFFMKTVFASPVFYAPFDVLAIINIALGVFNLVPGFPLDGGRVLRASLWFMFKDQDKATKIASWGGRIVAGLLIFSGIAFMFFGDISGLWLVFIGLFLNQAAVNSYKQAYLKKFLSNISVYELMTRDPIQIPGEISIKDAFMEYFQRYKVKRFPVVEEDALLGMLTIDMVMAIPHDTWEATKTRAICEPISKEHLIKSDINVFDALMRMAKEDLKQLLVLDEGKLVGILTKRDIMRFLSLRKDW